MIKYCKNIISFSLTYSIFDKNYILINNCLNLNSESNDFTEIISDFNFSFNFNNSRPSLGYNYLDINNDSSNEIVAQLMQNLTKINKNELQKYIPIIM